MALIVSVSLVSVSQARLDNGAGGSGSGLPSGTTGQMVYYAANGTTGTATSTILINSDQSVTFAGQTVLNGVTYTWPAADGTANYTLTTDGSGSLSWATGGSGTVNYATTGMLAYYPSNGTTATGTTGIYWDNANGNLGIGTSTNLSKLTVHGNLKISDTTGQLLLPLSNDATTPTLAFGDGDSGFYESSDNVLWISIGGAQLSGFSSGYALVSTTADGASVTTGSPTATNPVFNFRGDSDTGIGRAAADSLSLISGGVEMLRLVEDTTDYLRIPNNMWLSGLNYAGTAPVNMFKVNASDQIELGATLSLGGTFTVTEDGGQIRLINQNITSTPAAGTDEGYTFAIDNTDILTIFAESDASGGIQNQGVGIGTTTPSQELSIAGDLYMTGTSTMTGLVSSRIGIGTTTPGAIFDAYSSGTSTIMVSSDSATQGACLKLKDWDGSGFTYCVVADGTMSCSTTSCE